MLSAKKELFTPSGGGYQISRSVRLRSSASAYLNRTLTTPTNNKLFTWSGWVKRSNIGVWNDLFGAGAAGANGFGFNTAWNDNGLAFFTNNLGGDYFWLVTTQVFRDPSAWYHIVLSVDTTQATASNRAKIYVNGNQITAFNTAIYQSQNSSLTYNSATAHYLGCLGGPTRFLDGYMTEVNFIDGQALTPSSFGETNAITGVWQPKRYAGTYGTNGFYLNFSDNSNNTAATIGKDYSGNGNNWTPNNISVTAGATYDSMLDVPTLYADGGNGRGNYCVLNPLDKNTNIALSEGNLTAIPSSTADYWLARATMAFPTTGKWYWELTLNNTPYLYQAGIYSSNRPNSGSISATGNEYQVAWGTAYTYIQFQSNNAAFAAWGTNTNPTSGNVLMFAYDADNATMWIGRNGTWYNTSGTANPATNTDPRFSSIPSGLFAGVNLPNPASGGVSMNFGQRPFSYTPPTGFVALNTQNLPTPTISKGASYMDVKLWTGNGTSQTITGLGFEPDLAWIKARSTTYQHSVYDAVRTTSAGRLATDQTLAEVSNGANNPSFTSDGITVRSVLNDNGSGQTFVGWMWDAGTSTVTNTSGTISAQVRANPTAGFSVVTYTGVGGVSTIGHGLGVAPSFFVVKNRTQASDWECYFATLGNTTRIVLNSTAAQVTGVNGWNSTSPTSTVFTVNGGTAGNTAGNNHLAYCFAAVAGYSAFGKYTGNGAVDGPFVYLGFRPRYLLIKASAGTASSWLVIDTTRMPNNPADLYLLADSAGAEGPFTYLDITANGFKIRTTNSGVNTSTATYIYMAFAENPFKHSLAR